MNKAATTTEVIKWGVPALIKDKLFNNGPGSKKARAVNLQVYS